jgi:hypothetical protein
VSEKPKGRIYRTHDKTTGDVVFCRATTPAQAINFVTRDRFSISVATPDDLIGVQRSEILDATIPGVHPDQAPLPLGTA